MIRIGITGCGRILNSHLQGFKKLREIGIDNFRITALCARKESDALMFRKRGEGPPPRPPVLDPATGDPLAAPHTYLSDFQDDVDVKIYTDYREMIASGEVNAVYDTTTLSMHHQIGLEALNAGFHLLSQKPLAVSVRAAKKMVETAKAKNLTFGVFENVRQGTYVRAASWAVRNGLIGDPQVALMGSLGGLWSPDRVVAETPWRHRKLEAGGGGVIDIGVHQMHWQRYIVGEIAAVSGMVRTFVPTRYLRDAAGNVIEEVKAEVDDTYMATLQFERGTVGQLWWSWAMDQEEISIKGAPAVLGSKGSIRGSTIYTADGEQLPLIETFQERLSAEEREQFYPLGLTDPCAILNLDWLQAIEQGRDPETSGEEGLRDLACAFGVIESSVLGRTVTQDEVLSGEVDTYQREIDEHYGLI
jgi:1,5-anhydro-D-fructose reductase (1,5-anhydro-D-mannitol-forming)